MARFQNSLRSKKSKDTIKREGSKEVMPRAELDMKGLTFSTNRTRHSGDLVFLTKVYKSGDTFFLLGFYSHSPCGNVRDQEQGWMLINYETMEIVDEINTRSMGRSTGEFKEWYKNLGEQYGKAQYLLNELGEKEWKITDVD